MNCCNKDHVRVVPVLDLCGDVMNTCRTGSRTTQHPEPSEEQRVDTVCTYKTSSAGASTISQSSAIPHDSHRSNTSSNAVVEQSTASPTISKTSVKSTNRQKQNTDRYRPIRTLQNSLFGQVQVSHSDTK